ncbi:MAG: HD domain-containing protein [Methanobacteriota archaeon]|nr:MAG: HD domain-containing protein [Euryarchaeota archaeon]
MAEYKIIRDSVHGSVRFEAPFLSLIEANELQRLHSVNQLGLANLVYPGANHTRLEHSLGTFAVAGRMATSLRLEQREDVLVRCAAILHDIGHLPFSHTFETVLHEQFGIDHVEISRRLITGQESILSEEEERILGGAASVADALERQGIDPKEVASLIDPASRAPSDQVTFGSHLGQAHFNERRYLGQMVCGPMDVDQLDYLVRDAHYTGVAYGVIDLDRLLDTVEVFNGDLAVDKGGLSAVEGMLVARTLMFSSVYFHKTVRIAELMLAKAVEMLGHDEVASLFRMTDSTLLSQLTARGGYFEEVATRIKYRRLFKKAYGRAALDVAEDEWGDIDALGRMDRRRRLEEEIASRAGTDPGRVIIDVPSHELPISEPRMSLIDIRVIDGSKVRLLSRMSSIAQSLQNRRAHDWAVMVACPAEDRDRVARAAAKALPLGG